MNNDILQIHIEPNRNIGSLSSINQDPALIALSAEARSLTTARVRIRAGHVRKLPVIWGFGGGFRQVLLHHLQLTSQDLAAICQKKVTII